MEIAVIGAGYVGLTTAACMADQGNRVVCIDTDPDRVERLRQGKLPIYEPGLGALIRRLTAAGMLRFSTRHDEAVSGSDFVFLAVGTPSAADGSVDLQYIEAAALDIAPHLGDGTVVAVKSTVPPGTARHVQKLIAAAAFTTDFSVVSNPEFLREGSAIDDFQRPDRIVIGSLDDHGGARMQELYSPFGTRNVPFVMTSAENAELIKYASNAFLALKIGFINDLADLCEVIGGDVADVARGIGLDRRIGPAFLAAGPGFGGSCFPKDTRALAMSAKALDAPQPLVELVIGRNQGRMQKIAGKVLQILRRSNAQPATVAVLGLAFKSETDDMREAASLTVIPSLQQEGISIRAYDPKAMSKASPLLQDVQLCDCPYEAARDADAILILTEWSAFRQLDLARLSASMRGHVVIDYRNLFKPTEVITHGLDYFSVGRPAALSSPF